MSEYLKPGQYIDSDNASVAVFAKQNVKGSTDKERAISLYYAVRDKIR